MTYIVYDGIFHAYKIIAYRYSETSNLRNIQIIHTDFRYLILVCTQVIYLSCAVGGAYYSAYLSDTIATAPGTSAMASFTGGMVMLYGSRMAGGCTW